MKFPRLTSSDAFIQSNLDIGYTLSEAFDRALLASVKIVHEGEFVKADMEEIRKEWERRTAHLLPRPEWREPITKERT